MSQIKSPTQLQPFRLEEDYEGIPSGTYVQHKTSLNRQKYAEMMDRLMLSKNGRRFTQSDMDRLDQYSSQNPGQPIYLQAFQELALAGEEPSEEYNASVMNQAMEFINVDGVEPIRKDQIDLVKSGDTRYYKYTSEGAMIPMGLDEAFQNGYHAPNIWKAASYKFAQSIAGIGDMFLRRNQKNDGSFEESLATKSMRATLDISKPQPAIIPESRSEQAVVKKLDELGIYPKKAEVILRDTVEFDKYSKEMEKFAKSYKDLEEYELKNQGWMKSLTDTSTSIMKNMSEKASEYTALNNLDFTTALKSGWKHGDWSDLFRWAVASGVENAPSMILYAGLSAVASPAVATATIAATSAGSEWASMEGQDVDIAKRRLVSGLIGGADAMFESGLGMGPIMRRAMSGTVAKTGEKIAMKTGRRVVNHITKGVLGEMGEESGVSVVSDMAYFLSGIKDYDGIGQVAKRAFNSGMAAIPGALVMSGSTSPWAAKVREVQNNGFANVFPEGSDVSSVRQTMLQLIDNTVEDGDLRSSLQLQLAKARSIDDINSIIEKPPVLKQNKKTLGDSSMFQIASVAAGIEVDTIMNPQKYQTVSPSESVVSIGDQPVGYDQRIESQTTRNNSRTDFVMQKKKVAETLTEKEKAEWLGRVSQFMPIMESIEDQMLHGGITVDFMQSMSEQGQDMTLVNDYINYFDEVLAPQSESETRQQFLRVAKADEYNTGISEVTEDMLAEVEEMVRNGSDRFAVEESFEDVGENASDLLGQYASRFSNFLNRTGQQPYIPEAGLLQQATESDEDSYHRKMSRVSDHYKWLREQHPNLDADGRRNLLIDFIKLNMPKAIQHKMIESLRNVESDEQLAGLMHKVEQETLDYHRAKILSRYREAVDRFGEMKKNNKIAENTANAIEKLMDKFPIEDTSSGFVAKDNKTIGELYNRLSEVYLSLSDIQAVVTKQEWSKIDNFLKKREAPISSLDINTMEHIVETITKFIHAAAQHQRMIVNKQAVEAGRVKKTVKKELEQTGRKVGVSTSVFFDKMAKLGVLHHDVLIEFLGGEYTKTILDQEIVRGYKEMYDVIHAAHDMFASSIPKKYAKALFGLYDDNAHNYVFDGKKYNLTTGEILELYIQSRNPHGLSSLIGKETKKGKEAPGFVTHEPSKKYRGSHARQTITYEGIKQLRKTVESNQDYMSIINAWRNVSDFVYSRVNNAYLVDTGVPLHYEDWYLPKKIPKFIHHEGPDETGITPDGRFVDAHTSTIGSWGGLKMRTDNSLPLQIDGLFSTMAKSIRDGARYAGLRQATKNAYSVINNEQIGTLIKSKFGEHTYDSLLTNIEAVMGNAVKETFLATAVRNVMNNITLATFAGNPGPAIKTLGSYALAFNYIEGEYASKTPAPLDEVKMHPILRDRVEGNVSPEVNTALYKLGRTNKFSQKRNQLMNKGMSVLVAGDAMVVRYIYATAKNKIAATRPELLEKGREAEFHDAVGDMTYEIIRRSQPTFLTLDRPSLRRDHSIIRGFFPFSSQKFQNYNSMLRAYLELQNSEKTFRDKAKFVRKTTNAMIVSAAIYAAFTAFRSAFLHNTDDPMEEFTDVFLKTIPSNIPIAGDVVASIHEIMKGTYHYGSQMFENIGVQQIGSAIVELTSLLTSKKSDAEFMDMPIEKRIEYIEKREKQVKRMLLGTGRVLGLPSSFANEVMEVLDMVDGKADMELMEKR